MRSHWTTNLFCKNVRRNRFIVANNIENVAFDSNSLLRRPVAINQILIFKERGPRVIIRNPRDSLLKFSKRNRAPLPEVDRVQFRYKKKTALSCDHSRKRSEQRFSNSVKKGEVFSPDSDFNMKSKIYVIWEKCSNGWTIAGVFFVLVFARHYIHANEHKNKYQKYPKMHLANACENTYSKYSVKEIKPRKIT